jgi:hypothetical protein
MATAVKAGQHICLSVSRFHDLVAGGVITRAPPGKYDLDKVREEYCRHAQKVMQGRGSDNGASLSAQRVKLAEQQTIAVERRNAAEAGDLVSLDLIGRRLDSTFTTMREIALGVPGKIADSLQPHSALDRGAITEIVRGEIYEMLETLSEYDNYPPIAKRAATAKRAAK